MQCTADSPTSSPIAVYTSKPVSPRKGGQMVLLLQGNS